MHASRPRIAVIYLSFHCEPYIDQAIEAWEQLTYPKDRVELVVVDNPHPKHGSSVATLRERLLPLSGRSLPNVTILPQEKNLGFSHGVNAGIRWAVDHEFDYVYLHNDDGYLSPDALEPLVEAMEEDQEIAAAQSLILLAAERDLVNSAGNALHYCFFGFCDRYRQPAKDLTAPRVKDIAFASGAAVLLRRQFLEVYGAFDEDLFLYCEDLEYCCRLRLAGYRTVLVKESQFFHEYEFSRNESKLYWIERNRYAVMLLMLRIPTLVMLLPIVVLLELGLLILFWRRGWLSSRLRVYAYWSRPSNWRLWWKKRRRIQKLRRISDRELLRFAVPTLKFQEQAVQSPILDYLGNPVMSIYYYGVIRACLWW